MNLEDELQHQIGYARTASEFQKRATRIVHATGYNQLARIQIHGGVAVDYVWERQYNEGCRFTLLHVFKDGVEVPENEWKEALNDVNPEIYENGNTFK